MIVFENNNIHYDAIICKNRDQMIYTCISKTYPSGKFKRGRTSWVLE